MESIAEPVQEDLRPWRKGHPVGARTTGKTSHRQKRCLKQREVEIPWIFSSFLPVLPIGQSHQDTQGHRSLGNVVPESIEHSRAGNDCKSKQANGQPLEM